MPGKRYAIADDNVLIGNRIAKHRIFPNKGILKQNAVFNYRTAPYFYSAEKDTVFHRAFNHTAVRNQRILHFGVSAVIGRRRIADLCVNRAGFHTEQRIKHFLIFKWNETDIKVSDILKLTSEKPIFGHKSGKRSNTHWICFQKNTHKS